MNVKEHLLETRIDSNTGQIILQDRYKKEDYENIKYQKGWRRMYMSLLDLYSVCTSSKENQMLQFLLENIKRGFVLEVKNIDLEQKFGASTGAVSKFMKKMKANDFLRGSSRVYKTSPFVFIPYGTTDKEIAQAQEEWKKESNNYIRESNIIKNDVKKKKF